jgi:hypothetical protein
MSARLKPRKGQLEARRRIRAVSNHTLRWSDVRSPHFEGKPASYDTKTDREPLDEGVSYSNEWSGREDSNLRPLVPNSRIERRPSDTEEAEATLSASIDAGLLAFPAPRATPPDTRRHPPTPTGITRLRHKQRHKIRVKEAPLPEPPRFKGVGVPRATPAKILNPHSDFFQIFLDASAIPM